MAVCRSRSLTISGVGFVGIVKAVVRLGQSLVVPDHEIRAVVVVVRADAFEIVTGVSIHRGTGKSQSSPMGV